MSPGDRFVRTSTIHDMTCYSHIPKTINSLYLFYGFFTVSLSETDLSIERAFLKRNTKVDLRAGCQIGDRSTLVAM